MPRDRQVYQANVRRRLVDAARRAVNRKRQRDRAASIRKLLDSPDWDKATRHTKEYVVGWLEGATEYRDRTGQEGKEGNGAESEADQAGDQGPAGDQPREAGVEPDGGG